MSKYLSLQDLATQLLDRPAGGQKGSQSGGPGTQGARGSEMSGFECKIHQLKVWSADAIMFFFLFRDEIRTSADAMILFGSSLDVEPKFEHLRWL